jgi:hypothetical protein
MEAKINEKALSYMDKEGVPYKVTKDGNIQVDMYHVKQGQVEDLISILKTGTYPGENVKKDVTRTYLLHYLDGIKMMKTWNEEKDGPWPYHPDSTQVSEYVDRWLNSDIKPAEEVTKGTPEEKIEDLLVVGEDELPGWARSSNKAKVTAADAPAMNKIEDE